MKDKSQPGRARRGVAVLSYFALSAFAAPFSSPQAPYLGLGAPRGKKARAAWRHSSPQCGLSLPRAPQHPLSAPAPVGPPAGGPRPPRPPRPPVRPPRAPRAARWGKVETGRGQTRSSRPARPAQRSQCKAATAPQPRVQPCCSSGTRARGTPSRLGSPGFLQSVHRTGEEFGGRPTAARWRLRGGLGPTPSSPRGLPARPGPARRSPGTVPSPQVGVGRRRPPRSAALSLIPRCSPRCRPGFQTGSAGPRVLACVLPPKLTGAPCESPRLLAAPPRPHPLFPPSPPPHPRHFGTAQDLFKPWETGSGPGFALILFKNWRHRRGL